MSIEHVMHGAGPIVADRIDMAMNDPVANGTNGNGEHKSSQSVNGLPSKRDASHRQPFGIVLLAGVLTPSPLRQQLDMPALCLPMAANLTLLDLWLDALERAAVCQWIKIVVNASNDRQIIERAVHDSRHTAMARKTSVIMDPMPWRGPAGVLRDIVHGSDLHTESLVLAAEAACLPPSSLDAMCNGMSCDVGGAVARTSAGEPAGVYAFRAGILSSISHRGFHDIKEQLLPSLYARGIPIVPVTIKDEVIALRSPQAYLRAVATILLKRPGALRRSPLARISETAQVTPDCLIHDDVLVEDGAIVHQSVVLPGARIGGGAVVSNSIVAMHARVERSRIVKHTVVTPSAQETTTGEHRVRQTMLKQHADRAAPHRPLQPNSQ